MPQKLFDDDGKEIEVKTPEEIQADIDKAVTTAKTEVENQFKSQIETLSTDLGKLKEDKEKLEAQGNLTPEQKTEVARKEKEIADQQALIDQAKAAGIQAVTERYVDEQIGKLSGKDDKLKEAIKANMKPLTGKETQEQVNLMLRQAFVLGSDAVGMTANPSLLTQNFGAGGGAGRPVGGNPPSNADVSSGLKELGRKFGIDDKDWEQFGGVKFTSAD